VIAREWVEKKVETWAEKNSRSKRMLERNIFPWLGGKPISSQAVAILQELHPLTGHGRYIFPSERTPRRYRCMSENTLNAALKRLGYGKDVITAHGFRAMARTILDEVLGFRPDFIEHQLAHSVRDPNGRAYNRTAHLPERHKMMQSWADYLDGLKNGALVIPFKKAV